MKPPFAIALLLLLAGACGAVAQPPEATPPPAYVIAEIEVHDAVGYRDYLAAISPIVEKHGGTYLARAGQTLSLEGAPPNGRIVLIAFPSLAAAKAFHASPEAQAAGDIRRRTATSRIFVVEGAPP